jgi:ATP-dependent Clp protease ATP-binding subunit ClpA
VQKRFVARDDLADFDSDAKPFSRFTERARHVVQFARVTAAAVAAEHTTADHLAVALLSEPQAVAARVLYGANITDAQLLAAFGLSLPPDDAAAPERGKVPFSDDAKSSLREALKAALRLGHNYIGTEHILLGILRDEREAGTKLAGLGLTIPGLETAVKRELDELVRRQKTDEPL